MGIKVYYLQVSVVAGLKSAVHFLLNQTRKSRVLDLVFWGDCDDESYHATLRTIRQAVYSEIGKEIPVSFVPELLLEDGSLCVEVYEYTGDDAIITSDVFDSVHYQYIESEKQDLLWVEGIPSSDFSLSVSRQSAEIFSKLQNLLDNLGFVVSDIVRQWNYIGNIVGERGNLQNYQAYNDARTLFYQEGQWDYGYPAATGIGSCFNGLIVSCILLKNKTGGNRVYALNNPWQVPAHTYSAHVLVNSDPNVVKSTPKFERAKLVRFANNMFCFISGTASIRGEESTNRLSPQDQALQTLENIASLISKENLERHSCPSVSLALCNLRVYLKDRAYYPEIRRIVETRYPGIPTVYLFTDICRQELLVEIEGICQSVED